MNIFNRKILVIGLDGGSWDLFNDIIDSGYMPYLKKLKSNGTFGPIASTIPPISPAAWGTIQTGRDCLEDHIYEFYCFNKKTKNIDMVNSDFLKNTIWEILSKVGKKIAVVNVPMTYPPKKVNGFIVSGILTPSLNSNFTYPSSLKQNILNKIPDYQFQYSEDVRFKNPHYNIKDFIENRIKNIKDRTKVCVWLLNNYKIDILMVNFQANDILQHVLWGYFDKENILYNPEIRSYAFKTFHKWLDFCIETLREEFLRNNKGDLLTVILSDHGCESHKKQFLLGDWLYKEGLLKFKTNFWKSLLRKLSKKIIIKLKLDKISLFNVFKKLELKIYRNELKGTEVFNNFIDWKKSRVYPMGISLYGLIFILTEGEKKLKIINYLKNKFYQIKDPKNNNRIVDKIYEKDDYYSGNQPELIPDLIIKPTKGYSFTSLYQNTEEFLQDISKYTDFAIGKHSEEGILVIHGKNVKENMKTHANLKDIVPTILNYFGLPINQDLKGNILNCFKNQNQ